MSDPKPPKGKKRPVGRPPIYNADYHPKEAAILCAVFGATVDELARYFGVNPSTIEDWTRRHAEFSRARADARAEADRHVETRLHRRATGYSFPSEKIMMTKGGAIKRVPYIEFVPPEPRALEYWLNNRNPERWRSKVEVEHSGSIDMAGALARARKRVAG